MDGLQKEEAVPDSALKKFRKYTKVVHPKYGKGFVTRSTASVVMVKFDTVQEIVALRGKDALALTEIFSVS